MVFDGSEVNLLIAFLAGIVTFFASCLLPLVPAYLVYLSGVSFSTTDSKKRIRGDLFRTAVFFVAGFLSVFLLLGLTATTFGRVLVSYKPLLSRIGGIFLMMMGGLLLNILPFSRLYQERKITWQGYISPYKSMNAFLVGLTFGFGWTPCIGPVLAVILFWASQTETLLKGVGLLMAYGFGLGLPFLIVALGFEWLLPILKKTGKIGYRLHQLSGVLLIIVGVLLLTNQLQKISSLVTDLVGSFTL